MTRYDLWCASCRITTEVKGPMGQIPQVRCPLCSKLLTRYFGAMNSADMIINYGFRPHRYSNETDRRIAQYQFEHL